MLVSRYIEILWSDVMFRGWNAEPIRGRLFERGDMKYVILELLKERPRHGYDVIQALQERSGGWYQPSPGVVYPTLEMLADMGHVTVAEQDGKKTYSITPAGEAFLAERQPMLDEIKQRVEKWWGNVPKEELREMRREVHDFARMFDRYAREWPNQEKLRRI